MVLRNVAKTDSLEEQRQEINLLAADVNAISTDLSADTSPQLSADLDLNGNNITGATPGISISPTLISSGSYSFVGSGTPGGNNPSGNLEWNGSDNKLYFGDAYLTRDSNGTGWIGSSGTIFFSAANGVTVTNEGATETYFVVNAGSNTALYHNTTAKLTTAATGVEIFGNIVVSGTVDGRDLDTDGSKLDGIETGATADQTDAEIKTAYENNADTNAFTDAEQTKLSGIETGATADQTGAEIKTAYEAEADTNAFTDAEKTKLAGIEAGATVNAATGGTSGGIGTVADPQYGSVQFRGGTNTLLGDSVFVYDTTNNRLGINNASPDQRVHVSGNIEVNAYDNANGAGGYKTDLGLIIGNAFDAGITTLTDDRNGIIWQERALDIDIGTQDTFRVKLTYDGKIGVGVAAPGATVHIRDSDDATQGDAQLKISKGVGNGAVPETISRENLYLHLGSSEYGTNANGQYLIGFGYTNGETGTGIPAYIGFNEDDTAGYTNGSLVFGTRPNTLGDNVGRERMRITEKGVRQYPCANDASHAYQGIYQQLSGKKQLTGSGNFTDIVTHGHSCSYKLQYYVLENDNNSLGGGPGSADLFVRYGSGSYQNHIHSVAGMNGGSVSTPEIQYINSGSKLQFRATWSGSNPVFLYWHLSGCGDTKLTAL